MSQRLQAKSRLLFRFILSHRILFITVVAMLVLAGVGISNSSAVKSTLSVMAGNSERAAPAENHRRCDYRARGGPGQAISESPGWPLDASRLSRGQRADQRFTERRRASAIIGLSGF